jgi:hypothetical protein
VSYHLIYSITFFVYYLICILLDTLQSIYLQFYLIVMAGMGKRINFCQIFNQKNFWELGSQVPILFPSLLVLLLKWTWLYNIWREIQDNSWVNLWASITVSTKITTGIWWWLLALVFFSCFTNEFKKVNPKRSAYSAKCTLSQQPCWSAKPSELYIYLEQELQSMRKVKPGVHIQSFFRGCSLFWD